MFGDCTIEFLCEERKRGIIPEPIQGRHLMPEWYKKLTNFAKKENGMQIPTLKRCPPFLDAMSTGWIIPLAADVTFNVVDNGKGVSWESNFFAPMVENHMLPQIATHPKHPTIPLKILNHWLIKTPPGWSCLFVPPLNRPDDVFDLFSGIVETDKHFEYINFPGFLKPKNVSFEVKAGHPLMQVIPFKRNFTKDATIRTMSEKDLKKLAHTRDNHSAHRSHYRDTQWEKK